MLDRVEFQTANSAEVYHAYKQYQWFKQKGWLIRLLVFGLIGAGLYYGFGKSSWLLGFIFILLGFLVRTLINRVLAFRTKRYRKRLEKEGITETYYRVSMEELYAESTTDGQKKIVETEWQHVKRVVETEDGFYVYLHKKEPFILPKKDLLVGTPFQARELLWDRNRYKYNKKL